MATVVPPARFDEMSRINAEKLFGVPAQTFADIEQPLDWIAARLADKGIKAVEGFCEKIDEAMAKEYASWPSRIDAWVAVCLDAYLDTMPVHDLVFHQHRPANRAMKADNPVITRLMALLEKGAEDGAWEIDDPRLTAVMLFDALHGAVDDCLASGKTVSRPKLFRTVADFYHNALRMR